MKKEKYTQWQPEHFPKGTLVRLNVARENGGCRFFQQDTVTNDRMVIEVGSILRNGVDSYVIRDALYEDSNSEVNHSFNISHVHSIVKRGTGPMVWKEQGRKFPFMAKETIGNLRMSKKKYFWVGIYEVLHHLQLTLRGDPCHTFDSAAMATLILKQTFVKRQNLFGNFKVFSADKRKLRKFFKANYNRHLTPLKAALAAEDEQDQLAYEADMDDAHFRASELEPDEVQSDEVQSK